MPLVTSMLYDSKYKLSSLRSQVWPYTTSGDNDFPSFVSQMCTIVRKLDSFYRVNEPDHLIFSGQFLLALLYHIMLLDILTWWNDY